MSRLKRILRSEFEEVLNRGSEPVVLEGEAMPRFLRAIPDAVRCRIIASGQDIAAAHYSSELLSEGLLVGGIDVYRHSPDDPVPFNKDWYAVVATATDPTFLFVDGPKKEEHRWLPEIPERYAGVEIIGTPKDPKAKATDPRKAKS